MNDTLHHALCRLAVVVTAFCMPYALQAQLQAEYYIDIDPGLGQATTVNAAFNADGVLLFDLPTGGLSAGEHLVGVRAYSTTTDGTGQSVTTFGPTITSSLLIHDNQYEAQKVLYAEYFWGDDPGYGNGTPIAITPGQEITLENLQIPTGEIHGSNILSIRTYGTQGWSPTLVTDVLVDVEGNYTLNASAETSLANRNYQSLGDVVSDFSDRGVGDDVTLTVTTTGTEYALDATTDSCLARLARIAESLDNGSVPRDEHVITFTASEGSGNSLVVTTTNAGLPTVVKFFSRVATTNVTLTINGTSYDFTAASVRHQELCPSTATEPVALSTIGGGVKASWKAKPHSGTTITGYKTSGTGNISKMTLDNSGSECDSLVVTVTLKDADNRVLTTYDYTYFVHARVSTQAFATLTPADGTILNPGETVLRWSAIGDAAGYRLDISRLSVIDGTSLEPLVAETDDTRYELAVESGVEYTWTVTAIGYCDELTSEAMTLSGRLLPDLVVTGITLPQGAEAGNTITVTATIANQGLGATTETRWTDKLYYAVNSDNFAQAVSATEQSHNGNIAPGGTYTATFTMRVPYVESGQLRVWVATDTDGKVMESDDSNNRAISATSAQLKPFYMHTGDLAALRKLYSDFGGEQWNGKKWDCTSELILDTNWSGVTFDTDGRVTAINLQGRGLTGTLNASTMPDLPLLATLNLSRNTLDGDVSSFVNATQLPTLTTLNLGYNRIAQVSGAVPATVTTLNLSNQTLDTVLHLNLPTMDLQGELPSILTYDHARHTHTTDYTLRCKVGNCTFLVKHTDEGLTLSVSSSDVACRAEKGDTLAVTCTTGAGVNSTLGMTLDFDNGDANFDGEVDVLDLQTVVDYILKDYHRLFNFTAANLWEDNVVNLQDLVLLVDVLLDLDHAAFAPTRAPATTHGESTAHLFVADGRLCLHSPVPVAALDIRLKDCTAANGYEAFFAAYGFDCQSRTLADGLHLVAWSLGDTLPTGDLVLCDVEGEAPVVAYARLADSDARPIDVILGENATQLADLPSAGQRYSIHSLDGLDMTGETTENFKQVARRLKPGVYIIKVYLANGSISTRKITIEAH